ncbi:hypothetical protein ACWF99_23675 [Nocardia sp. NPDC055002]
MRNAMIHAVIEYDNREAKKPAHNIYALPQYLKGVDVAATEFENGSNLEDSVNSAFHGRLAAFIIRSCRKMENKK